MIGNSLKKTSEIKGRLFDPHFTTKEVGKGRGMGLCMVQGIMKNSGGGIVLDAKPGAGTCFALYFPLADMPTKVEARTETTIPSGPERILASGPGWLRSLLLGCFRYA